MKILKNILLIAPAVIGSAYVLIKYEAARTAFAGSMAYTIIMMMFCVGIFNLIDLYMGRK